MQKNILITGASGFLGQATVKKFIEEGHNIIAVVPQQESLNSYGGKIKVYTADLMDEREADRVAGKIVSEHERIDAAILLVGGYTYGDITMADGESLKRMIALNFETAYFTVKPVFHQMLLQPQGGKIIFIGAKPTLDPSEGKNSLAYSLSKSLLFKLAEYLNEEGSAKNVKATMVVPSIIDTPQNRSDMPQADFSKWVKPEEIAEVLAFVCSEKGDVLKDTVLKVYGRL